MRNLNLKTLIAIIITTLTFMACNQTNKTDDKDKALTEKEIELLKKENELLKKEQELNQKTVNSTTDNSTTNNLDFLKKLNGKYPYEVNLFENSIFTQRLEKLLGKSRYNFLTETWAVEVPMEYANNIFVASGCQAHNCASTNFIIVFDFSKKVMYAGMREENEVKTYSEDGSNSTKVIEWENGN